MGSDPVLVAAAATFAGASVFGSAVSVRHDLPGKPFGMSVPLSVPAGLLAGWGAGVAAPWPMPLAALIAAAASGRSHRIAKPALVCEVLGIGCIAGTLVEPVTYRPSWWPPAVRAAIVTNVAASALLTVAARRTRRRRGKCS